MARIKIKFQNSTGQKQAKQRCFIDSVCYWFADYSQIFSFLSLISPRVGNHIESETDGMKRGDQCCDGPVRESKKEGCAQRTGA